MKLDECNHFCPSLFSWFDTHKLVLHPRKTHLFLDKTSSHCTKEKCIFCDFRNLIRNYWQAYVPTHQWFFSREREREIINFNVLSELFVNYRQMLKIIALPKLPSPTRVNIDWPYSMRWIRSDNCLANKRTEQKREQKRESDKRPMYRLIDLSIIIAHVSWWICDHTFKNRSEITRSEWKLFLLIKFYYISFPANEKENWKCLWPELISRCHGRLGLNVHKMYRKNIPFKINTAFSLYFFVSI